jgi:atypical dual specificity phosphatase
MAIQQFAWVVPDQLAACANPAYAEGLVKMLLAAGIGLVVNLDEPADSPELLARLSARGVHLPMADFVAPPDEQLDRGVAAIRSALAEGTRVAVHCFAGLGRTGTLVAAYLVGEGHTADEAIARVRAARPGSIDTLAQELAVHGYARRLGRQAGG